MTILITILLLITIRPTDGGNHPRKDEMRQPTMQQPAGFHPPKEWDR